MNQRNLKKRKMMKKKIFKMIFTQIFLIQESIMKQIMITRNRTMKKTQTIVYTTFLKILISYFKKDNIVKNNKKQSISNLSKLKVLS